MMWSIMTNKIQLSKKTKTILIIEGIFIIGVIIYLASMKPTAIAPVSGHVISENDFSFQFENARRIIIAKSQDFENSVEFNKDFAIRLPPGTYYWKAKSWFRESETMNFTIANKVSLRLDEINGELAVYNTGTMDVKIRILDGEELFENKSIMRGHYTKINNTEGEIIIEGEQE